MKKVIENTNPLKFILVLFLFFRFSFIIKGEEAVPYNRLTPEEEAVILHKATEKPFSGKYVNHHETGVYTCRRCNAILYRSSDKFDSSCGWPSFDEEVPYAVNRAADPEDMRTEILCARCGGHLGHVFSGEKLTPKNIRHCVNSISMNFVPDKEISRITERAYFAGGCFWGMEYYFEKAKGVVFTVVGYMGGSSKNPTYEEVCTGKTGHKETLEVIWDPLNTSYEEIAGLFFEIHDPTQTDGQGPDLGDQYLSCLFYTGDTQKQIAEKLIKKLKESGYKVSTHLEKASIFWKAEKYHQHYYDRQKGVPYCHTLIKRFQ